MLKTYTARDQQTVYDLAVVLYGDARGISPVLLLNPGLDLDAETYFGQAIIWDDAIKYEKEVFVLVVPKPARAQWKSRDYQNVYDLAIQVYGDINDLDKILSQVDQLADPPTGTMFDTVYTENLLANTLFNRNIVATSPGLGDVLAPRGIGIMVVEFDNIVG